MADTLKITVSAAPTISVPPNSPSISAGTGGGGGVSDHGQLNGLSDDDHPQYVIAQPPDGTRNVILPSGIFSGLSIRRWTTAIDDQSGNAQPLFQICDQTGATRWLSVVLTNSGTPRVESSVPLYMTNRASVQFFESVGNGVNKITVQGPSALAADWTMTLPTTKGNTGQALLTDGNGVTSWGTVSLPSDLIATGPSVYGRAAGSAGTMAAIAATADNQVLRRVGGALSFGAVPTGTSSSVACAGDDSRLSDARTPTAHTHDESEIAGLVSDLNTLASAIAGKVNTTVQVNGHALSSDVTVTKGDIGLGNVENTALSTWAGTNQIITTGTITTGVWHGTLVGVLYGGTGADMSGTGGTNHVVKQASAGAAFTTGAITFAELSSAMLAVAVPADVANSTTNYADVTGYKLTLGVGTWVLDGEAYTTASGTSVRAALGFTFSGSTSAVKFKTAQPHVATNINTTWNVTGTADNGVIPAASMGSTESPNPIGGIIVVTAGGDFQIRFKANAAGTVNVLKNSWLRATKIA